MPFLKVTKKDFLLVTLIGFLVGILILPIAVNLGFRLSAFFIIGSIGGFTIFAPAALWFLYFLAEFKPIFAQFGRYAAVGTLNTLLDLSALNLLIFLSGQAAGIYFTLFKGLSFWVGMTNSYFWNKFWTFNSRTGASAYEYVRFGLFTFIGFLINVTTASLIVNLIGPIGGADPRLWANIAALSATGVSFLWNFLSYRYLVFRH